MTDDDRTVTVLIAEDEVDLAEVYEAWLARSYNVRVANDGESAVGLFDEAVDAVLLDRRMPGMSGDEVLDEIRSRGSTVGVAMITAVDPSVEAVSMPFDEYVVKPVGPDDLESVVQTLLRRAEHDDAMRRHYRIASKIALLERHLDSSTLADSEEYDRLQTELDAVDRELSGAAELDAEDVGALLRSPDGEQ
jgi:DNA-binding response OmpR family regulator